MHMIQSFHRGWGRGPLSEVVTLTDLPISSQGWGGSPWIIYQLYHLIHWDTIKLMVLSSWNHLYQLAVSSENAIKCHQNSVVLKLSNWVWHWRRVAKSNRASVPVRQGQTNGSFPSHVSRFVIFSILFTHLCLHQPRKNRLSLASVGQDRQQTKLSRGKHLLLHVGLNNMSWLHKNERSINEQKLVFHQRPIDPGAPTKLCKDLAAHQLRPAVSRHEPTGD